MKNHKVPDFTQFKFNLPEELIPYIAWVTPLGISSIDDPRLAEVEVLAPADILQRYPTYSYFYIVDDLVLIENDARIYAVAYYGCTYEVKNDLS